MRLLCGTVLIATLVTFAHADATVPVDMEMMTSLPLEGDICTALDAPTDCSVIATEKIFRLGRANIVERLGDGVTHFDVVIDTTEGRWTAPVSTALSDCGMHHCADTTVTRGPSLRAITIGGRPSLLVEVRQTTTHTGTDPDTGKATTGRHESTTMFLACTRTKEADPSWQCMAGSIDADHCTLTITGAGKVHTGCTTELTFDQPTD